MFDFQGSINIMSKVLNNSIYTKSASYIEKSTGIGQMVDDIPRTASILKILEPITLPNEISICFFVAAISDAASSGRLVPSATIVKPITLSLMFNALAMIVALSISISAPKANIPQDTTTSRNAGRSFIDGVSSSSFSGCLLFLPLIMEIVINRIRPNTKIAPSMRDNP